MSMTAEQIIEKLRPTLRQEGLEVDFLGREGAVVNIRAKRVAPGVPVAFLVKAIAGTFKRYLPEVEDICLTEYDPGESIATAPSETFEPVFKHRPPMAELAPKGVPVVDLSGLDRREAIQAIENFVRIWKERSPVLGLRGLDEDAPGRAARKWAAVYREDYHHLEELSDSSWEVLFAEDGDAESLRNQGEEVMPARIFLTAEVSQ